MNENSCHYNQFGLFMELHDMLRIAEVVSMTMRDEDEIHVQCFVTVLPRELGITEHEDRNQRIGGEGIHKNAATFRLDEEAGVSQPDNLSHFLFPSDMVAKKHWFPRFPSAW